MFANNLFCFYWLVSDWCQNVLWCNSVSSTQDRVVQFVEPIASQTNAWNSFTRRSSLKDSDPYLELILLVAMERRSYSSSDEYTTDLWTISLQTRIMSSNENVQVRCSESQIGWLSVKTDRRSLLSSSAILPGARWAAEDTYFDHLFEWLSAHSWDR